MVNNAVEIGSNLATTTMYVWLNKCYDWTNKTSHACIFVNPALGPSRFVECVILYAGCSPGHLCRHPSRQKGPLYLNSSRKLIIHSFSGLPRSSYPPRVLRLPHTSASHVLLDECHKSPEHAASMLSINTEAGGRLVSAFVLSSSDAAVGSAQRIIISRRVDST